MQRQTPPAALLRSSCVIPSEVLAPDHFELDIHVAAYGMRIRADVLMRFPGELNELRLRQALVLDAHLHLETETAAFARTDRHGAGDLRLRRVALPLLGNEVERPAEAGGISRGKQLLWCGRTRLARAAHLLGHRHVGLDDAVAGFAMAVAAADRGRGGRKTVRLCLADRMVHFFQVHVGSLSSLFTRPANFI